MSKHSRGQKCICGHPRIKHNPNAGKCFVCDCHSFRVVKYRQHRLKEDKPKAKQLIK